MTSTASILFVDDERHVLDGLRDQLRKCRREWEMVFANGGAAGLEALRARPFDVVVSDMRMPEMDGAEFLTHVRTEFPSSMRVVLSGYADRDALLRAVPVAQQFLNKPCDVDHLRRVIRQLVDLRGHLTDETVRQHVGRLDTLPSLPRSYAELLRVVNAPNASVQDVARLIGEDSGMTVKVLQIANSAYFGSRRPLASIEQAVAFLGFELIKLLVLVAHVFAAASVSAEHGFSVARWQQSALMTARIARGLGGSDEAFTAGLVHDVGRLVLAVVDPTHAAAAEAGATGAAGRAAERAAHGIGHPELGAYLLGSWGLPLPIVEAVAYHHAPATAHDLGRGLIPPVHVAAGLVEWHVAGGGPSDLDAWIDMDFVRQVGWADQLSDWIDLTTTEAGRFGAGGD